jgi:hypothetical protein
MLLLYKIIATILKIINHLFHHLTVIISKNNVNYILREIYHLFLFLFLLIILRILTTVIFIIITNLLIFLFYVSKNICYIVKFLLLYTWPIIFTITIIILCILICNIHANKFQHLRVNFFSIIYPFILSILSIWI